VVQLNKNQLECSTLFVVALDKGEGRFALHGNSAVDGQESLACYLSPFDALVDVGLILPERRLQILEVANIVPEKLTGPGRGLVSFSVHMAWQARAGRVLLRPDGAPQAVMFTPHQSDSWKDAAFLAESIARLVDEVHERAGLFAWRETAQTFSAWGKIRLEALVQEAWAQALVMDADDAGPDFDQFALFDPEFRQWHFVPAHELTDDALAW